MTTVQTIGIVLGSILLLTTICLLFVHFEWHKKEKRPKWLEENLITVVVAFLLFNILGLLVGHFVSPDWWQNHLLNPTALAVQGVWLVFGGMIPKGTGELRHKLGRIGIWIAPIGLLLVIIYYPDGKTKKTESSQSTGILLAMPNIATNHSMDFLTVNPEGRAAVKKILDAKDLPDGQEEFVLGLFGCESGYRQFEDDGKTPYHVRGPDGKIRTDLDVEGIGQIHKSAWPELKTMGPDYDTATMEGNVNATLLILNNHGGRKWDCFERVRDDAGLKEVRQFEPPTDDKWSEIIQVTRHLNIHIVGPIVLRGPDKIAHRYENDGVDVPLIGRWDSLELQSGNKDEATTVVLTQ